MTKKPDYKEEHRRLSATLKADEKDKTMKDKDHKYEWDRYWDGKRTYPPIFEDRAIGTVEITRYEIHKFKINDYGGYPYIEIRTCYKPDVGTLKEIPDKRLILYAKDVDSYISLLKKAAAAIEKAKLETEELVRKQKKEGKTRN